MLEKTTDPRSGASPPVDASATLSDDREEVAAFPLVGVGASAGGLEAFIQLLEALPADTGMAFVLIQHLLPTHPSALAEILSRATRMPVTEVHDEPTILPDHVYVIPPDRSMIVSRGALQLLPREDGIHRPIDQFFRSLAADRRHQAIAVVLSGTATDGTLGLEAVKGEGGITFAQDGTAQHDGMPTSAVTSGCVDFVLPPAEIAREIVRIGHHLRAVPAIEVQKSDDAPLLRRIAELLHRATGVDFTHYKWSTLYRRITRRMVFQQVESLADYVSLLQRVPAETRALYQDILINVTSFFRDDDAYDALKTLVFPRLIEGRSPHEPVRFWTLGCSTGQETYSLVMAFTEVAEAMGKPVALQVFATDLNAVGIERARAGRYPKDIAQDVSPERLSRFFVEADGQYRISKAVRDACVFSRHNVLSDPPFSHLDLISCRNLLIYLQPVLQRGVLPTLHYALEPGGVLWLGSSETVGAHASLFDTEDAQHKIYRKKTGPNAPQSHFLVQSRGASRAPFSALAVRSPEAADLPREADRLLSSRFAPPGVLVSADLEILQFRGHTERYLAPAPGKASLNLLKMLREGLLVGVHAAVLRAGAQRSPVREEGLKMQTASGEREVSVEVIPVQAGTGKESGFVILFEEARAASDPSPSLRPAPPVPDSEATRLTQELVATREYLRALIEQQETANEELQSANEEIQSANEELQSSNEELETSKEEIQSSNEELRTVNDELHDRNAELSRVNNDLVNLLGSIQTAIVILGPDLRIRRFTPAAEKLLNLIPTDVGRPLTDIQQNLRHLPDLQTLLLQVLDTLSTQEREVQDRNGRWFSMRLRPYRTLENGIDGVVLMLIDVDAMKRAHAYTESIIATMREPLLVLDEQLRVQVASRAFHEAFGTLPAETMGRPLGELGDRRWDVAELHRRLGNVLVDDSTLDDFELVHEGGPLGKRLMVLNARRLVQPSAERPSILLAIEDVTERRRAEEVLREGERRFREMVDALPVAVYTTDAEGRITHANRAASELTGQTEDLGEARWCPGYALYRADGARLSPDECPMAVAVKQGLTPRGEQLILERPDGTRRWVEPYPTPLRDAEGTILGGINMVLDVTDRKESASALEVQNERLHQLWEAAGDLLSSNDVGAMLRGLLARIGPQLGVDAYFKYRASDDGALRLISSNGVPEEALVGLRSAPPAEAIGAASAALRRPVALTYIQQSDDPRAAQLEPLGLRACFSTPLMSKGRLLGAVSFASRSKDAFAPDELSFLETISRYVAFAYARQWAQEETRASEARLRFVLDSLPQKVFTTTPGGVVDYVNSQWRELTTLPPDQVKAQDLTQLVHRDDIDATLRLWQHALDTGEPLQVEQRFRLLDGTYHWHLTRAAAMRNDAGEIVLWVGSNTDVQALKQTELALHETELRYRRLFEAAKDGILLLDFDTEKVFDANPFMRELLGHSDAYFMGKELWEIGLYGDRTANELAIRELKATGYLRHEHLPLVAGDGRSVDVEVVANAYSEGAHRVIQCNIRDITERSALERQLRDQASELAELHKRKDEFLAMLSHELRNPLAPIAGAVHVLGLAGSGTSPKQRKACAIIERQVAQLQRLIDDLLEVSRITTGKLQLRLERVDGVAVARDAIEAVEPLLAQHHHELTLSLPTAPLWLDADAARLQQVMVNLLTNAVKFTQDGGRIALTLAREGARCVLCVRDSGVGISPELLPRVFELFTQGDRPRDPAHGGLGVGLALAKRIVELHGGEVAAESVLGQGSEISVRLPLASTDASPSTASHAAEPSAVQRRVLIVDDNEDAAAMLGALLEAWGHEVRTAGDGPEALSAAAAFPPDVVVLDIGLPGMNGYEVAAKMRLDPALAKVVLVALTGYGQESDRQRTRDAGFHHHLVKPVDLGALKKILAGVGTSPE